MPPAESPSSTPVSVSVVVALAVCALVTSCAGPPRAPAMSAPSAVPHGFVAGAAEAAEPQLRLATVDAAGELELLDLLDGASTRVASLDQVSAVSTDGRYLFASAAETDAVTIVDTGVWSVDHEDHQHYYRAEPGVVGTVVGSGAGVVSSAVSLTTVRFADTGTGIILDRGDLGDGTITELGRVEGKPGAGVLVPFGDRVIAGRTDAAGTGPGPAVQVLDPAGKPVLGEAADCAALSGTITTPVGVVFGCADGALLALPAAGTSGDDAPVSFTRIPYPEGVTDADRATEFRNRAGRPTVAAVAGNRGAWLLDTRERRWTLLTTDTPLAQVSAVDDSDGHVVALARDGRVLVLEAATGDTLAATAPLLDMTLATADPGAALPTGVELTVDKTRAYLNAPAEGLVYEIDFADNARIARTFPLDGGPRFLAETGR